MDSLFDEAVALCTGLVFMYADYAEHKFTDCGSGPVYDILYKLCRHGGSESAAPFRAADT